jgi:CubicO group peptidase (beta-lactamase class C family)
VTRFRAALLASLLACAGAIAPVCAIAPADLAAKAELLFAPLARPGAPGAALIVPEAGKPVVDQAWGHASIEYGVPFTRDAVVRLPYSEAREFLATAAVLMEEDGLLALDAPLRERFPELPAWAAKVSAWDLLTTAAASRLMDHRLQRVAEPD